MFDSLVWACVCSCACCASHPASCFGCTCQPTLAAIAADVQDDRYVRSYAMEALRQVCVQSCCSSTRATLRLQDVLLTSSDLSVCCHCSDWDSRSPSFAHRHHGVRALGSADQHIHHVLMLKHLVECECLPGFTNEELFSLFGYDEAIAVAELLVCWPQATLDQHSGCWLVQNNRPHKLGNPAEKLHSHLCLQHDVQHSNVKLLCTSNSNTFGQVVVQSKCVAGY